MATHPKDLYKWRKDLANTCCTGCRFEQGNTGVFPEIRTVQGSADFKGFTKPPADSSESGSDSTPPPAHPTLYLTRKTVEARTYHTNSDGSGQSGAITITTIESWDRAWTASVGGKSSERAKLSTKCSGGGSITSHNIGPGAYTATTTITHVGNQHASTDPDQNASDDLSQCTFRTDYSDTLPPRVPPRKPTAPSYGGPPGNLLLQSVSYLDPVEWDTAHAEAQAWLDGNAEAELTKLTSSDAEDTRLPYVGNTNNLKVLKSVSDSGFLKTYQQYRWRPSRCGGTYAGITWLEVLYSPAFLLWKGLDPSDRPHLPPSMPVVAEKAWEYIGVATADPRCDPFAPNAYTIAEEYGKRALASPWSAIMDVSLPEGGVKELRSGYIAEWRSDYGTPVTRFNFDLYNSKDLDNDGKPDSQG